jgi:hypothetical protein
MRRFMRRRRHAAKVKDPLEMRMGSPQYGQLILHGEPVPRARDIEFESLVWSGDRRLLAGQELVSWLHEPRTRVVIYDADRRLRLATSPAMRGFCTPIRFEDDALVYGHLQDRRGERELRLEVRRTWVRAR